MSTLVIHPSDPTTDFLSEIYKDKDWTIIRDRISNRQLYLHIKNHDNIIMLGHGTPNGLLGWNNFVIDSSWVYLLREKNCIGIWCHANIFFEKYGLKGFYSGMIISEMQEAVFYRILPNPIEILESNELLALAIKESIHISDDYKLLESVKSKYKTENNPIILFNQNNLYVQ